MSDQTIFIYGSLAAVLCLLFLVVTLYQYRKIGKEADDRERMESGDRVRS